MKDLVKRAMAAGLGWAAAGAAPVTGLEAIAGKEWRLAELKVNGEQVELALPPGRHVTLTAAADGRVSGQSAVNRYFGKVEFDGEGGCTWGRAMGATRMAGPPEMMAIESRYLGGLPATTRADLTAGRLTFSSGDGRTVVAFGGDAAAAVGAVIEGRVVFPPDPDAALPEGAVVKVLLRDVSLADAPARELGSIVIRDAAQFPVKFRVPCPMDRVRRGMRYTLSARIEDASGLRFINDTAHPVLQDGTPPAKPVDVTVIKVK